MNKMKFKWLFAIICLIGMVTMTQAQVTPTSYGTFTSVPTVITTGATSNVLSAIDWRQGKTLAVFPYFGRTNAGTANVVYTFDVSYDGTNYATDVITKTNAGNGTTAVMGFHLFLPTAVDSVAKIRLKSINNADGSYSIFPSNVVYSWRN